MSKSCFVSSSMRGLVLMAVSDHGCSYSFADRGHHHIGYGVSHSA